MEAEENVVADYDVSYDNGGSEPCAFSRQAVYPTYTYTTLAKVDPGCPVNAAALFTATAAAAMNLKSKNLKLRDYAQFPQCESETIEGVFQSPAYIIMYGMTFYEYKAAKLFKAAKMMTLRKVKVESNKIDEINLLKKKWKKSITRRTRRTTTLVKPAPESASISLLTDAPANTEALELKDMCVQEHGLHAEGCDLIYDGLTSANVYQVHRCPAGPTARAQLLLMSRRRGRW